VLAVPAAILSERIKERIGGRIVCVALRRARLTPARRTVRASPLGEGAVQQPRARCLGTEYMVDRLRLEVGQQLVVDDGGGVDAAANRRPRIRHAIAPEPRTSRRHR